MKKRILLINPPWFIFQNHVSFQVPMGLCYIGAVLEHDGHEVLIWNADYSPTFKRISEGSSAMKVSDMTRNFREYQDLIRDGHHPVWDRCRSLVEDFRPDYVGVSTYTAAVGSVRRVSAIVKSVSPRITVVVGGPHVTVRPRELMSEATVDISVTGEGETAFSRIVLSDGNKENLSRIPGLWFRNESGKVIPGPPRNGYEDVASLPFPAKHLVFERKTMPPLSFQIIYSSRGCPYRCIFCGSHHTHGRAIRFRDPASIVDEIEHTQKRFGTYNFFFCDDTFTAKASHAEAVIDMLLARRLDIAWSCQTRPENITERLARKMKQSGCQRVSIGVETGHPRVRQLIRKGNTIADIELGFERLKRNRIDVVGFFMFGFPTETKTEMQETVRFMRKLDPSIAHCNFATPDPGTELMDCLHAEGHLSREIEDWSQFFHQSPAMLFSKNFSKAEKEEFVREVQRVFDVHNRSRFRRDLIRRLPFILRLIARERIYRYPNYLLAQAKGLI